MRSRSVNVRVWKQPHDRRHIMKWNVRRVGAVMALLVVVLPPPARAQNWPTRAVRFMVPFGPGAGADIGARLFAEKLQAKWGQPVVIENKPGGDGIVAIQAYLGANDDHVLMFGPSGGFVVHPFTYKNLSYNQADLIPIARVSNTILAVAVKKDAPYNNLKEFTEAARAAPGTFNSGLVQGHHRAHVLGLSTQRKAADRPSTVPRRKSGPG